MVSLLGGYQVVDRSSPAAATSAWPIHISAQTNGQPVVGPSGDVLINTSYHALGGGTSPDPDLLELSAAGTQNWFLPGGTGVTQNPPAFGPDGLAYWLETNSSGNLYLASGTGGTPSWRVELAVSGTINVQQGPVLGANGLIYVAVEASRPTEVRVFGVNPAGQIVVSQRLPSEVVSVESMAAYRGGLVISGGWVGSNGVSVMYLSPAATLTRRIEVPDGPLSGKLDVNVDGVGYIIWAGSGGSCAHPGFHLLRVTPAGESWRIEDGTSCASSPPIAKASPDGGLVLLGGEGIATSGYANFATGYDASGAVRWSRVYDRPFGFGVITPPTWSNVPLDVIRSIIPAQQAVVDQSGDVVSLSVSVYESTNSYIEGFYIARLDATTGALHGSFYLPKQGASSSSPTRYTGTNLADGLDTVFVDSATSGGHYLWGIESDGLLGDASLNEIRTLASAVDPPEPSGGGHHGQYLRYAALGDSFASGQGLDSSFSQDCGRAQSGTWGQLLFDARPGPGGVFPGIAQYLFCSGNTADQVRLEQVPQVSADTDLVTISAGGNTVGFADTLIYCLTVPSCDHRFRDLGRGGRDAISLNIDAAYGDLYSLYSSVRSRARDATVFVVGYPQLVTPPINRPSGCLPLLNDGELEFIRDRTDEMNAMIRRAAADAGVHYVDVVDQFDSVRGGVCGDQPKINGLMQALQWKQSFHPNGPGNAAYAARLSSAGVWQLPFNPLPQGFDPPTSLAPAVSLEALTPSSQATGCVIAQAAALRPACAIRVVIRGARVGAEAVLTLHSDPIELGRGTVDTDGTASLDFELPPGTAFGSHTLVAEAPGAASDTVIALAPVTVADLPSAPTGLRAVAGDGRVDLAWTPPAADGGLPLTSYRIYRDGTALATTTGTTHTDTGLSNGQAYRYSVAAITESGEGPGSAEATGTPRSPFRVDAEIRKSTQAAFKGDGIYNTTATGQSLVENQRRGTTATYHVQLRNEASVPDSLRVLGTGSSGRFVVAYYVGSTNVTNQVVAGTYRFHDVPANATRALTLKITVRSNATLNGTKAVKVTATSVNDTTRKDAVKTTVKAVR